MDENTCLVKYYKGDERLERIDEVRERLNIRQKKLSSELEATKSKASWKWPLILGGMSVASAIELVVLTPHFVIALLSLVCFVFAFFLNEQRIENKKNIPRLQREVDELQDDIDKLNEAEDNRKWEILDEIDKEEK